MIADWWTSFFGGPWHQRQVRGYSQEKTSGEVDFILAALGPKAAAPILDMPCGEGRHCVELASRGFRVTGVDLKPEAVALARNRASQRGVNVELRVADMREFSSLEQFDHAICFGGSFGYFDDRENAEVLRAFFDCLRPGGSLLLDTQVSESLLPRFRERDWSWDGEGEHRVMVIQERRFDLRSSRIEAVWTTVSDTESVSRGTSIRIYSYRELEDLLREVGFTEFESFVTGTREPFVVGSPRLGLVARK